MEKINLSDISDVIILKMEINRYSMFWKDLKMGAKNSLPIEAVDGFSPEEVITDQ